MELTLKKGKFMQNLIVGIIVISIIAYIIFARRTKKLYSAIDALLSRKSDSVTIKQSLEQIRNTIQAQFKNVISTDKTILFEHKFNSFIVVAASNKEVLVSLAPSEEEIQNFEKLENEIINTQENKEITGIERMKALAGDMIDDIISTDKHTRIHESYDEFIHVFKDFSTFKEYEEAFTVVINRHKSNYKITIMREDNSFSAYWEPATFEDIMNIKENDNSTENHSWIKKESFLGCEGSNLILLAVYFKDNEKNITFEDLMSDENYNIIKELKPISSILLGDIYISAMGTIISIKYNNEIEFFNLEDKRLSLDDIKNSSYVISHATIDEVGLTEPLYTVFPSVENGYMPDREKEPCIFQKDNIILIDNGERFFILGVDKIYDENYDFRYDIIHLTTNELEEDIPF